MFVDVILCREDLVDSSQKCLQKKEQKEIWRELKKGKDYES